MATIWMCFGARFQATASICATSTCRSIRSAITSIYNNQGSEDRAQAQAFVDTWLWEDEAVEGLEYPPHRRLHGGADTTKWTEQTVELIRGLEKVLGRGSLFAYLVHMTLRIGKIHRVLNRPDASTSTATQPPRIIMSQTSRLGLPFIEPGQAQKELYHNESLRIIDVAVAVAIETVGANAPPASPVEGQCFIVGSVPTGAWAGHAGAIAGYAAGGWRFAGPLAGMRALDKASGQTACHDGAGWVIGTIKGAKLELAGSQVVGARLAAVANPSGGANVDAEARAAIVAILDRLRGHGLIAP